MARLQRKRFTDPSEVRHVPHGRVDIVELDDVVVGRMTHEPGWRWSVDVKAIAGTELCEYHHLGYTLSGHLRSQLADGTQLDIGPGDVFEVPPGHDSWVVGDEPWVAVDFAGVRAFGRPADRGVTRTLVSLLFSDIVGSTELASRLGDGRWREVHAEHNERAEAVVDRFDGRLVKWTGDGMLATFASPERAIRAAATLRGTIGALGLHLRQGIHTGEVEVQASDLRGVAVHVAARIMALGDADEILVSATAVELVEGSGLTFIDRGRHEFKGVSGDRQVYALAPEGITTD